MRCAIYIRVSTEEQAREGFSIRAQKERLEMFAMSQDWNIVDYYIDEGRSAKDTNREQLQRMLEDIEDKKIDVVLVYKLDRLTRSVMDLYKLLERFEEHGCMFKSSTEVFDTTTPTGRLFITLVAAVAQWERENSAERVKFGMHQMIEEGKWHGGTVPYGYYYNKEERTLEINDEEATILKYIFSLYQQGKGDNTIANIVSNEMKIRTRNGLPFSSKTIRDLLTNPVAYGALRYGDELYEDFMVGIIPKEQFEYCQQLRASKRSIHPRNVSSSYIFTGVVRCARCGSPLKGRHNKHVDGTKYKYLCCINSREKRCDLPLISEENLERHFLTHLEIMLKTFHETAMEFATSIEDQNEGGQQQIKQLMKQLQTIKDRKKKWQIAYANDIISLEELREHTRTDSMRQQEIETQISEMQHDSKEPTPDEIVEALSNFLGNWDKLEEEEKKQGIIILLDSFYVDADNDKRVRHIKRNLKLTDFQFK